MRLKSEDQTRVSILLCRCRRRNQRNKLKLDDMTAPSPERRWPSSVSLRHHNSSDHMAASPPAFHIPNLRVEHRRKTNSAEDCSRKSSGSAGSCETLSGGGVALCVCKRGYLVTLGWWGGAPCLCKGIFGNSWVVGCRSVSV